MSYINYSICLRNFDFRLFLCLIMSSSFGNYRFQLSKIHVVVFCFYFLQHKQLVQIYHSFEPDKKNQLNYLVSVRQKTLFQSSFRSPIHNHSAKALSFVLLTQFLLVTFFYISKRKNKQKKFFLFIRICYPLSTVTFISTRNCN